MHKHRSINASAQKQKHKCRSTNKGTLTHEHKRRSTTTEISRVSQTQENTKTFFPLPHYQLITPCSRHPAIANPLLYNCVRTLQNDRRLAEEMSDYRSKTLKFCHAVFIIEGGGLRATLALRHIRPRAIILNHKPQIVQKNEDCLTKQQIPSFSTKGIHLYQFHGFPVICVDMK